MHARIAARRILLFACVLLTLSIAPAVAQDGHWLRVDTRENMTGPKQLAPWPGHKFSGKSGDSGLTYELTRTSTVDGKTHVERGHFSWSLPAGFAQWMVPGGKLRVEGKVSNQASEGSVTASVVLARYGFSKGGVAVPPGSEQTLTGEAEVPKPSFDKNGNAFLELTFSVSGGNETKFIERTFIYKWTPGKPPSAGTPGVGKPSGEPAPGPTADAFAGDWYSKASDSKLTIAWNGDGYDIQYVDKGVLTAKGKGFAVGGRLVFTFYRVDRSADGGFGVAQAGSGGLAVQHYNFNGSSRWQGTYTRQ